jgi:hypothetical protein
VLFWSVIKRNFNKHCYFMDDYCEHDSLMRKYWDWDGIKSGTLCLSYVSSISDVYKVTGLVLEYIWNSCTRIRFFFLKVLCRHNTKARTYSESVLSIHLEPNDLIRSRLWGVYKEQLMKSITNLDQESLCNLWYVDKHLSKLWYVHIQNLSCTSIV